MWNTPENEITFTGPYGLMLARGIRSIVDEIRDIYEYDDEFELGIRVFDAMTIEQKIWSLHKVTLGLLCKDIPVCELYAYLEATVAAIFQYLETQVIIEIDEEKEYTGKLEEEEQWDFHYWRNTLIVPYNLSGGNSPDIIEDDEPLTAESTDADEWEFVIELLESLVLWDNDYDLPMFDDMNPEKSKSLKEMFNIVGDYFTAVPEDPKRNTAKKLLNEIARICDEVIKREEPNGTDN